MPARKDNQPVYKVTFLNKGQIYELYAQHVFASELWGFIEIEDFVFDEKSQMVVDPSEEKLKAEFAEVKRSFIPMQAVMRIDEVEKQGSSGKISSGENVTPFPLHLGPHSGGGRSD